MTWADDRARLNHDVLSNYVENELLSLQSRPCSDTGRLSQFLQREDEFVSFLDRSTEALSYVRILDGHIFDVWTVSMRQEIRFFADALFITTSGIPTLVAEVKDLLTATLTAAREFLKTPLGDRNKEQVLSLRKMVTQLRDGISRLPRNPGEEVANDRYRRHL